MADELKSKIKEFVELAKTCPENLQQVCFELLLKDHLKRSKKAKSISKPDTESSGTDESADNSSAETASQEDFSNPDLHVKTRKFLSDSDLSIDHLNQIFFKEGEKVEPLFDDLKTTKLSESQIRIALLQAFKNAISSGNFAFDGEEVRKECQVRKCYDPANFTANFKSNKSLFEGFEKYDRKSSVIKLSKEGRNALTDTIKDLQ